MNYYGINPSSDFFAHYGVLGMRWGVRRAIKKNNKKALSRHYEKALKKLNILSAYADINFQSKEIDRYAKKAKTFSRAALRAKANSESKYSHPDAKLYYTKYNNLANSNKHSEAKSKRLITEEGHAKAIAKRDAWKKEMDLLFSGTEYDRSKKKRRSRNG